jgi:hypothetical protein
LILREHAQVLAKMLRMRPDSISKTKKMFRQHNMMGMTMWTSRLTLDLRRMQAH